MSRSLATRLLLAAACLAPAACNSIAPPPKSPDAKAEAESHAVLERELSLYSD